MNMWRVYLHPNLHENFPKVWAYADDGRIKFGKVINTLVEQQKEKGYGLRMAREKERGGYEFLGQFLESELDNIDSDFILAVDQLKSVGIASHLSSLGVHMGSVLKWKMRIVESSPIQIEAYSRSDLFQKSVIPLLW